MTISKKSILIVCTLCSAFVFSLQAHYQRRLLFLGNENIPPIIYNKDGEAKGIIVDLTQAIIKAANINAEIKAINWSEAQKLLKSGKADALLQINKNINREEYLDFSYPLLRSQFCIFKAAGRKDISNLQTLNNQIVGVESNGLPKFLLQKHPLIKIKIIPNFIKGFEMIKKGEIDALIVDKWVGEYQLAVNNIKGITVITKPVAESYSTIAVTKGNKKLLDAINNGITKINNNGEKNKILQKWSGKEVIRLTKDTYTFYRISIILSLICFVLLLTVIFYVYNLKRSKQKLQKLNNELIRSKNDLEDIKSELEKQNKYLEVISHIDPLTNIYNRRFLDEVLNRELKKVKRKNSELSILLLDIDFFKDFNDKFGHVEGDIALEKVAFVIKHTIKRPNDIAARFGGEEFIVLLPDTPAQNAKIVAEKIKKNIEDLKVETANKFAGIYLTVSIGVATAGYINSDNYQKEGKHLINKADRALLISKNNGRNLVSCHE